MTGASAVSCHGSACGPIAATNLLGASVLVGPSGFGNGSTDRQAPLPSRIIVVARGRRRSTSQITLRHNQTLVREARAFPDFSGCAGRRVHSAPRTRLSLRNSPCDRPNPPLTRRASHRRTTFPAGVAADRPETLRRFPGLFSLRAQCLVV